jgi:hypothetical protein
MASGFILALAKKRPSSEKSDSGEESDDLKEEPRDDYSDVAQSALDDLAEILGVGEKDRDRFDSAMEDLCEACAKRAVSEEG